MRQRKGPRFYALIVTVVVMALFALGWWLLHDAHIPVLQPSGTVASSEQRLIAFTVALSALVVIPVFALLVFFAWRYREGNQKAVYQPEWADNRRLEYIWWGIPIVIIIALSIVTWQTTHALDQYRKLDSPLATMEIRVVALQWKWLFIYPEQKIVTVNQIVVPVNQPVRFKMTADAPMSAFWVPALGSQMYTMNGMNSVVNLMATRTGLYDGYNTNINGKGYADMKFTVRAVERNQYNDWVNTASKSTEAFGMPEYNELAKAGTSDARTYRLLDDTVYDQIVAKYMDSMGGM